MSAASSKMRDDTQLATLLRLWREGQLEREEIDGLGPLPPGSGRAMRGLHNFFRVCFGLRLADGTDEPMMVARSLLVNEGIVSTPQGASKLLRRFEELAIVWCVGSMDPIKGMPYGTKLWLPGAKPEGPEPTGGWVAAGHRVRPASSGVAPDAELEGAPIPVEAGRGTLIDVEASGLHGRRAVEPASESPDERLVIDAVDGGGRRLNVAAAAVRGADTVGRARHTPHDNAVIGGGA